MRIAVLFGGISPERNVSITGGIAVVKALRELGHHVVPIDPALGTNCLVDMDSLEIVNRFPTEHELAQYPLRNMIDCINSEHFDNIDVAFLVLHGKNCEDGKIQALLELRGIPYTGSNVKASSVAIDKNASKMMFAAAGIITPHWLLGRKKDIGNYDFYNEIRSDLGNSIVIKPNDQGSSIGVTIILDGNLDDIHHALVHALEYSEIAVIETYIEGRELTVGIIGKESLPVIEIIPEDGFYDYTHKYSKGRSNYECPADITEDIDDFVRSSSETAFMALGCSGFGRCDFRLNDEGQPFLMEVNTIPGFTSTSLVPMAAKELGIEFPELCERIIDIALNINIETEKNEEES